MSGSIPVSAPAENESGALRSLFDSVRPLTVGVEEEIMLLDPEALALTPRAGELLASLGGDGRFKPELPAAQLEIMIEPRTDARAVESALVDARRTLAGAVAGIALPAAAGVHPFAAPTGELSAESRYEHIRAEYGAVASRQLVASLQVHVAVGGAERTLAVYNALRSYLPEIAALAANAPIYCGEDAGLASVRPKICELLPRQGVPPAFASWEDATAALRWGARSGTVVEPRLWWWELRPHPIFGTLEVRVPDAQTTVADAGAVVAFVHALVAWLSERHDAGAVEPVAPTWRIEENRWSAARHGVEGTMADLDSGERVATRERLAGLLEALDPIAVRLGCESQLLRAAGLVGENGAMRQRSVFASGGARAVAAWLAERFAAVVKFDRGGDRA